MRGQVFKLSSRRCHGRRLVNALERIRSNKKERMRRENRCLSDVDDRMLRRNRVHSLTSKKRKIGKEKQGSSHTLHRSGSFVKAVKRKNEGTVSFLGDEQLKTMSPACSTEMFSETPFDDCVEKDSSSFESAEQCNLHKCLIYKLKIAGFMKMTRIQKLAIPKILQGFDVLIRSETGSGKSLAFLIPAIQLMIQEDRASILLRSMGTRVLILSPTRELVSQTINLASRLVTFFPRLVVGSLTGGEKRKSEKSRLRKGVVFLGATVGRLCDHLSMTQRFRVADLQLFILDEADRLLDMGFESKLKWIVKTIRESHAASEASKLPKCSTGIVKSIFQTVLVSATLFPSIKRLANFLLRQDQSVWISTTCNELSSSPQDMKDQQNQVFQVPLLQSIPDTIEQYYTVVTLKTRLALLISLFLDKTRDNRKVVVFCSTSDLVEYYFALFQAVCWPNENIFQNSSGRDKENLRFNEQDVYPKPPVEVKNKFEARNTLQVLDDKTRTQTNFLKLKGQLGDLILGSSIRFFKLHGGLTQVDRIGFLNAFNKCTQSAVLFTTDVAARGLNFTGAPFILQCDPPQDLADYVHRVGRTGRLQEKGSALLFVLQHEKGYIDYLRQANICLKFRQELELFQPLVQEFLPERLKKKRFQNPVIYLISFICRQVEADLDLLHYARRAFTGCYRAYRCYSKELKGFFDIRELHWGHQATALGLNEPPSFIGRKCRQGALSQQIIQNKSIGSSKSNRFSSAKNEMLPTQSYKIKRESNVLHVMNRVKKKKSSQESSNFEIVSLAGRKHTKPHFVNQEQPNSSLQEFCSTSKKRSLEHQSVNPVTLAMQKMKERS